LEPGWLVGSTTTNQGFLWPAIDVSSPTCTTNYSYGLVQPAVTRSATNFLGIPTMCGSDFDLYFATKVPRNPYWQVVFTTPDATSGTTSSTANIGFIDAKIEDISSGTAVPLTFPQDINIDLSSTSLTGYFAGYADGPKVTSVVIPKGNSVAIFYYGDTTAGTPQITASGPYMVPAVQTETVTAATTPSPSGDIVVGQADHVGSDRPDGTVRVRGQLSLPSGMKLHQAKITLWNLLSEGAGAGELTHSSGGGALSSLVLSPMRGSTDKDAVFETERGVTPRIEVKISAPKKGESLGEFWVWADRATIDRPTACSGEPSETLLQTYLTGSDGSKGTAAFNSINKWRCRRDGELTLVRSDSNSNRRGDDFDYLDDHRNDRDRGH
jgi:hypothetical protein